MFYIEKIFNIQESFVIGGLNTFDINIEQDGTTHKFNPDNITINLGDRVNFHDNKDNSTPYIIEIYKDSDIKTSSDNLDSNETHTEIFNVNKYEKTTYNFRTKDGTIIGTINITDGSSCDQPKQTQKPEINKTCSQVGSNQSECSKMSNCIINPTTSLCEDKPISYSKTKSYSKNKSYSKIQKLLQKQKLLIKRNPRN